MRCFNHLDTDAVGTCKKCNKGLCTGCAVDLGHGLACRDVHETAALEIDQLVTRNIAATRHGTNRLNWFAVPTFNAFIGGAFVAFGLIGPSAPNYGSLTLGCGFLVYAAVVFVLNLRAWRVATAKA